MKELARGLITFVGSLIVFTPVVIIGIFYNVGYPFVMMFKEKSLLTFFKIWWRLIDGTCAAIGQFLFEGFAINYDILGNVWGEWLEDATTYKEETKFGEKNITISASIGYLEHNDIYIYKTGEVLSKALNIVFRENAHALGSWLKKVAIDKIHALDLKQKK